MAGSYIQISDLCLWATEQDLIDLSNYDGEICDEINEDVVNKAICGAQGEIDSYLCKQYGTPLPDPVPDIIKDVTAFLTVWRLRCARNAMCEGWPEKYAEVKEFMMALASGEIDLCVDTVADPTPLTICSEERKFTRHRFRCW